MIPALTVWGLGWKYSDKIPVLSGMISVGLDIDHREGEYM